MKNKLILNILSFFLLIIISCNKNCIPIVPIKMKLPKQITSSGHDFECFWAPNGEYIAFCTARNTYNPNASWIISELWIMNKDGTNQRPLISVDELYEITDVMSVSWSQNSIDMLVHFYVRSIPTKSEIWRVSISGDKIRLSLPNDEAMKPRYSPDGTKIAFIIQRPIPSSGSSTDRLYIANDDFSDTLLIEHGPIGDYDWKSNSDGLIYSLFDRSNLNYDLWESSLDGTIKRRISETSESEEKLSCSSDGKYVAYSDYETLNITPIYDFNPKHLINNARLPQWIPNRNLILFLSEQNQGNHKFWTESWIVDLHGNVIKKIAEGEASWTSFSATGDYFVYSVNGNIWLDYLLY